MNRKIKIADYLIEISATVTVITFYFVGKISLAYALLGIILSLSLVWPFKTKKKSPSRPTRSNITIDAQHNI